MTVKHPWNKNKSVGQMKPFTKEQTNMIRSLLKQGKRTRDTALFSLAIDTMLRSSDILALRFEDVTNSYGEVKDEFCIRQMKTSSGTIVGIRPETQKILTQWLKESGKQSGDYVFTGIKSGGKSNPITHRQYSRLVKEWAEMIRLDPKDYSTHSLRRSKAAYLYTETNGNIELVRQALGQKSVTATSHYLNISKKDAINYSRETDF